MEKKINQFLFIHADNVHVGGGKLLLDAILASNFAKTFKLQLDSRMDLGCIQSSQTLRLVAPTIFSRLVAQLWLRNKVEASDTVLCFGNLPPLFKNKGNVVVFLQNRFLIESVSYKNFSLKVFIRLILERLWFRYYLRNVNQFIVQTYSMKISLENYFSRLSKNKDKKIKINISNFINTNIIDSAICKGLKKNDHKEFDFMYPASGEPYKNHKKLIDAFIILAEDRIYPTLVLTLDEKKDKKLLTYIEDARNKYGLNIINVGIISFQKILELYATTNCLIYPSLYESSGLPLLEAKMMGISVVAGELDYVRDSITPSNTFDPNSAISISRAVKRQVGIGDDLTEIMGADDFLLSLQKNLNL